MSEIIDNKFQSQFTETKYLFSARIIIFSVLILLPLTLASDFDYLCEGKPYNHLIAKPDDCKSFIICREQLAIEETCSTNFWFDPTKLVCTLPGPYCSDLACHGKSNYFAADPYECGVYHYCSSEAVLYSGVCEDDLTFVASSQTCTYPHCWESQKIELELESSEVSSVDREGGEYEGTQPYQVVDEDKED